MYVYAALGGRLSVNESRTDTNADMTQKDPPVIPAEPWYSFTIPRVTQTGVVYLTKKPCGRLHIRTMGRMSHPTFRKNTRP